MKTWLKGLAVFVFSSLVTGLAATNLDPANFNFSRAGMAKLGSLVAIIGAKAVLLYLKQSPLPAESPNPHPRVEQNHRASAGVRRASRGVLLDRVREFMGAR
jgi:hypothetical protein